MALWWGIIALREQPLICKYDVLAHQRWDVQMDRAAFEESLSLMSKDMHEQLSSHLKRWSAEELWSKAWFWDSQHHSHLNLRAHLTIKENSKQMLALRRRSLRVRQEDVFLIKQSMRHTWGCLMSRTEKQQEAYWQSSRTMFMEKYTTSHLYWREIGEFCKS